MSFLLRIQASGRLESLRSTVYPAGARFACFTSPRLVREASLNSAIGKGLRKSQGLGFRGKEWTQNRVGERDDGRIPERDLKGRSGDRDTVRRDFRAGRDDPNRSGGSPARRSSFEDRSDKYRTQSSSNNFRGSSFDKDTSRNSPRTRYSGREDGDGRHTNRQDNVREKGSKFLERLETVAGTQMSKPMRKKELRFFIKDIQDDLGHDLRDRRSLDTKAPYSDRDQKSSSERRSFRAESQFSDRSSAGPLREGGRPTQSTSERQWRTGGGREVKLERERSDFGHNTQGKYEREPRDRDRYQDREVRPKGRFSSDESGHTQGHRNEPSHQVKQEDMGIRITKTVEKNIPISVPYTTPASVFLYGTTSVEAALKSTSARRRKLYKLYIYSGTNREDDNKDVSLERLARRQHIPVVKVSSFDIRLLDKMSGGRPHNGLILEASPLPQLPVTSLGPVIRHDNKDGFTVNIGHQTREDAAVNGTDDFIPLPFGSNHKRPLVLYLDRILDPGNLGAIIRTANFLGVSAVVISSRESAPITPIVIKASAGASENITLFSIKDINESQFLSDSKQAGWNVFAAVAPQPASTQFRKPAGRPGAGTGGGKKVLTTNELAASNPLLDAPCLLVLGSEGQGLRYNIKSQADFEVSIPGSKQRGDVDSLNVSVATGILCNSFLQRREGRSVERTEMEGNRSVPTSDVEPNTNGSSMF